jgi:hypothetical protein
MIIVEKRGFFSLLRLTFFKNALNCNRDFSTKIKFTKRNVNLTIKFALAKPLLASSASFSVLFLNLNKLK